MSDLALLSAAAVVAIVVYFLPALIAGRRWHRSSTAIFVLNLFLGWTLLGWVAALVWALTGPDNSTAPEPAATRACPHCAEQILAAAKICKHCKLDVTDVSPPSLRS